MPQTTQGECELVVYESMFSEITDVGSVICFRIFADGIFHRSAQHVAQDAFIPELTAKAGDSPGRSILQVEVHPEHIAPVIIMAGVPFRYIGCAFPDELKFVVMAAPVEVGYQPEFTVRFPFY